MPGMWNLSVPRAPILIEHPALEAARQAAAAMRAPAAPGRRKRRAAGLVAVPGTWGRAEDAWYKPGSAWASYMAGLGLPLETFGGRPFEWSTALDGWQFWRRLFGRASTRDHWAWQAGGAALFAWLVPPLAPRVAPRDVRIVCHSHGLQVVLYAAAAGLEIDSLVSIMGPVRADMAPAVEAARPRIRRWLHVHADRSDRMQWLGALGDGALGIVRAHPAADLNHAVPGVGHSGVLEDPAVFGQVWPAWAEFLKGR